MMRKTLWIVLVMLCIWNSSIEISEVIPKLPLKLPDAKLIDTGKRIFRDGILSTGQKLEGIALGDMAFTGAEAACANCHRRSGMGGAEAGQTALPVTGAALYQPGPPTFWYQHEMSQAGVNRFRPAYTDGSLAHAIRTGKTPTGRSLQAAMPRFHLPDADMAALIAYLKSLSETSTAVDDNTIHFATVITPDAKPAEAKAMLDVMAAFFKAKNAETIRYKNNGHIPPNRGFAPLLNWELHEWRLNGPPESWREQLESYYQNRPVFAVLGGVGVNWQPVDAFCEDRALACLFPNTNLPVVEKGQFYSVYFSRGLALEAEVLVEYLRAGAERQHGLIVQVYRDDPQGKVPADAFRQAMLESKMADEITDRVIAANTSPDAAFWHELIKTERPNTLILWLDEGDLANLKPLGALPGTVYLSGHRLKGQLPESLKSAAKKIYMVSPWEGVQGRSELSAKMRTWLDNNQVAITDELLQGNTLWLMWLMDEAVEQITSHFSVDYLIERIEELAGTFGSASWYPNVSLSSRQHFAVKGCYILSAGKAGQLTSTGKFIVPP